MIPERILSVTDAVLAPLRALGPAKPMLTWYDDQGDRTELSVVSMTNWAAKTANWLRDDLDTEPGSRVSVLLPAHWQTLAVLLGSWWVGACVTESAEIAEDELAFVPADQPGLADDLAGIVVWTGLDGLGVPTKGLTEAYPGTLDYVSECRTQADDFFAIDSVPGDTPATEKHTVDALLAAARDRATDFALSAGDRVLVTAPWTGDGLVDLLAILISGASVVQCHPDLPEPGRMAEQERVVATLGVSVDGIRRM